jgi:hypothetical protein
MRYISTHGIGFRIAAYVFPEVVKANKEKIRGAYSQKGGWEPWLQVELGLGLQSINWANVEGYQDVTNLKVEREYYAWEDKEKVDIRLDYDRGDQNSKVHWQELIELKCASERQDDGKVLNFLGRFLTDYDKLNGADQVKSLKDQNPNTFLVTIGVTVSSEVTEETRKEFWKARDTFGKVWNQSIDAGDGEQITLWINMTIADFSQAG